MQKDDLISRTAAVDALEYMSANYGFDGHREWHPHIDASKHVIKGLPPAQQWTYVEVELPETIINEHTHDYQEYNCLCDFGDNGFDVRTYKFGNGHFWNGPGAVDKYVIAWQPLPEIPDALK